MADELLPVFEVGVELEVSTELEEDGLELGELLLDETELADDELVVAAADDELVSELRRRSTSLRLAMSYEDINAHRG